ncbi:MAG: DNA-directed RNA polymerase subunit beta' [Parcubacteria group bacterium]|nr:DNA-directed RNA polymerase subunit beta' [Parcubacteria group bacterium]
MAETKDLKIKDFEALALKLASPEEILSWSQGEVTRAETINYRTQKPEKEGLFSEQIFGPIKDYECACGKYKTARYKGVICDRCGVEVTRSSVRRERMGHIALAAPVAHIWFLRSIPSRISLMLDISSPALEKVIYYNSYIVTAVDEEAKAKALENLEKEFKNKIKNWPKDKRKELESSYYKAKNELEILRPKMVLSEIDYLRLSKEYAHIFSAATGSEPVKKLLEELDLKKLAQELEETITKSKRHTQLDKKILARLRLVRSMIKSGIRPEWMFLTVLPVLPPELRPMVQLDGGRFASSDLNDLYRRVINRNNRLKKLLELKAPEVIIKNEKRMLQEAVDALIDNSIRKTSGTAPMHAAQHRPLRSLADILQGKQGRFRQNLLGKRVDYSGRSVIVIGPDLHIHECGIPKKMALELFKPFVIGELMKREIVFNPRAANRLIEEGPDIVWEILETVVKGKYVLLNRAPTLHRLSVEAFQPRLTEGLAIQIPALVCQPFNADFDGDQMAVHLPLTEEAQREAQNRMLASLGLLKPADGDPVMLPRKDMILGIYWLTMDVAMEREEKDYKIFANNKEVFLALENKKVTFQEKIKLRLEKDSNDGEKKGEIIITTPGRVIFNNVLPEDFPYINKQLAARDLKKITRDIIYFYKDFNRCSDILDAIKELGFYYATVSGITWGLTELRVPEEKPYILENTQRKIDEINSQYQEGLLTAAERKALAEEQWRHAVSQITDLIPKTLSVIDSAAIIFNSGSGGDWGVATQIMGMKGLVVNPAGKIIDLPIIHSHQEGFNVLEYFAASHGGRKGLADTALKTSFAGYLTRRLVDVSQEVIVREEDCHTQNGLVINKKEVTEMGEKFEDKIRGRYLLKDAISKKGTVILKANELIDEKLSQEINDNCDEVVVRSPLTCETPYGVCQKCYGLDLGWLKPIDLGEAIGIIAAQSIGEPGTQLTLRTFHTGGVAQAVDITQGLPRVEELVEARIPKGEAPLSDVEGEIIDIEKTAHHKVIHIKPLLPKEEKKKSKKTKNSDVVEYIIPEIATLWVKTGDKVKRGDQLCEGNLNLKKILKILGKEACQNYILKEIKKVYNLAGEKINDKHLEVIIRQMFSRVKIIDPGESDFLTGEIIEKEVFNQKVAEMKSQKKKPPRAEETVLGIKNVALTSSSVLAPASFQETTRVLVKAALEGRQDYLRGLKENVIIGRLIPAGTGFRKIVTN